MSLARLDFEVELKHALNEIGATESDEEAYIRGLRNGGVLVLASGPDERVEAAAQIMNRQGGMDLEKLGGPEPELPEPDFEDALPSRDRPLQTGRIREATSFGNSIWNSRLLRRVVQSQKQEKPLRLSSRGRQFCSTTKSWTSCSR
jgi:acylphosphatase